MISVIITTYMREPAFVVRAVTSVLHQTYKETEIIVVDDSPADYQFRREVKAAVCECGRENQETQIRYIEHDTNKGACAARNTGLKFARGEYIAYLDDDDEWLPEKLEKQLNIMESTDAGLVYCGRICKNDITGVSSTEKIRYYRGSVFDRLLYMNFIGSTSFPLIRTDCLREAGGFDEKMQSAQDVDVWLRIAEKHTVEYVAEPLVIYHEHGGEQITSNPVKKINGLEQLNQKYKKYIDADPRLWHRRHIFITPYYAMAGDRKKAFRIWLSCVRRCPGNLRENLRYLKLIMKGNRKQLNG